MGEVLESRNATLVIGDRMIHVVFWPYITNLEGRLDLLEKAFPRHSNNWVEKFSDFHHEYDGAIVVINGGCGTVPDMRVLNDQLRNFRWVLLISIGDEGSSQHMEWIDHPSISIWVMEPKPGKHDKFHRVIAGPLSECSRLAPPFQVEDRPLDWFFSGSVRDEEWDKAIRGLSGKSEFYTYHLGYAGYVQRLASAKVVPCRPCLSIPETCRVYDALEAGCVPIVGTYPLLPNWWQTFGFDWPNYWEYTLGEIPPFPIIDGPEYLPEAVEQALSAWPNNAVRVHEWWIDYKERLVKKLQDQVQKLR